MLRNLVWALGGVLIVLAAEFCIGLGLPYLVIVLKLDIDRFRALACPLGILGAATVLVVVAAVKATNRRWGFVYCLLVPGLLTAISWAFNRPADAYLAWVGWRCLDMVCGVLGFVVGGYFGSRHRGT